MSRNKGTENRKQKTTPLWKSQIMPYLCKLNPCVIKKGIGAAIFENVIKKFPILKII